MLRALLRSTLYSSSRPFSSRATRDSSFSTLTISLLPVLRGRPKIFRTLSNIKVNRFCRSERVHDDAFLLHRSLDWQSRNNRGLRAVFWVLQFIASGDGAPVVA